jgi:hypothetical protein
VRLDRKTGFKIKRFRASICAEDRPLFLSELKSSPSAARLALDALAILLCKDRHLGENDSSGLA